MGDKEFFVVVVLFNIGKKDHPDSSLTTKIRNSKNEASTLKCYWASFKNAR